MADVQQSRLRAPRPGTCRTAKASRRWQPYARLLPTCLIRGPERDSPTSRWRPPHFKHGARNYLEQSGNRRVVASQGNPLRGRAEANGARKYSIEPTTMRTWTGLASRALFMERLKVAIARLARSNGMVGVLFVDLDRFKWINSEHPGARRRRRTHQSRSPSA